jgi:hypothetical protein
MDWARATDEAAKTIKRNRSFFIRFAFFIGKIANISQISGKACLIPVIQDGVERGESAVDLLGGGPASSAASLEQGAFSAFLRDSGVPGIDFWIRQDIPDRPRMNVAQHPGRMVAEADVSVMVHRDRPAGEIRAALGKTDMGIGRCIQIA